MPSMVLEGQRWFYVTWGSPSKPAVLLLHGFTGSHASFDAVPATLQDQYFLIAPDLPGHGQTPAPTDANELAMAVTADRLSQLLRRLAVSQAIVWGYSMGGRLALHLAIQHPQLVTKLVLESASPGLRQEDERRQRRMRDNALADAIERQGIAWFVPYWANQPLFRTEPPALKEKTNRIREQQSPFGLAQSLRGAGTGAQESLWESLTTLPMPVLLITGARDSKFESIAQEMAQLIPRVQWVSVDEAGHTVHDENPTRFWAAVHPFLTDAMDAPQTKGGTPHGI